MEQNIAVISKKVWDIVKVAMFMIKKGLCKKKIFMDLNMMMKRGKIARKALKNLMFHHHKVHNHQFSSTNRHGVGGPAPNIPKDVEPTHLTNKAKNQYYYHHQKHSGTQYFTPLPYFLEDVENSVNLEEVSKMVEMVLRNDDEAGVALSAPSPIKPAGLGFRRSPAVRQLRITDSPFPVQMNQDEDTKYVDQAADDFIKRFYCQLNQQSYC